MSLEEAYAAMGGDLQTVRGRLQSDERIAKFAKIFLSDTSLELLLTSLDEGNFSEAYRGAHTLKGMSRDLGFTPLFEASSELSEALKLDDSGFPQAPEKVPDLLPRVEEACQLVSDSLQLI
jgi:HPt (histidine-containing phosphotransfer) domain-containing protein